MEGLGPVLRSHIGDHDARATDIQFSPAKRFEKTSCPIDQQEFNEDDYADAYISEFLYYDPELIKKQWLETRQSEGAGRPCTSLKGSLNQASAL